MYRLFFIFFCLCSFTFVQASVSVIPLPQKCLEKRGFFNINSKTVLYLSSDTEEMRDAVSFFNDLLNSSAGFSMKSVSKPAKSNVIHCKLVSDIKNDEAYRMDVSSRKILIEAKTPVGIFYAFQTLRQLLPPAIEGNDLSSQTTWDVPCVNIEDSPSFAYRGLMMDVSRHFIDKNEVKRYIDLLAFHKMNVFHWHLTDDQGWRLEIKKYPKLTSVGGFRNKTIIGYMWDRPTEWDTKSYGGFYTQEDIKEVVAYAKKRFVEIIPEIEMPGHAVAALAAYPQYSCSGGPFEVEGRWGVFNDIFCTKESTFKFLTDILDEVISLFPSDYIHLGGDEAPRVRWRNCVHCQERIKQEGLVNEAELQTYFMNRIESYLNSKGKKIIGWDEILEGGIPQRATVMSWRGEKGGIKAAKAGYDVIMSPNIYLYFNNHQLGDKDTVGIKKRLITLEKVYNYHPVPKELTEKEAVHVKGVQANLWTEYVRNVSDIDYSLYPRMAALSELAWTDCGKKIYNDFCTRLDVIKKHYDALGINYCKGVFIKDDKLN